MIPKVLKALVCLSMFANLSFANMAAPSTILEKKFKKILSKYEASNAAVDSLWQEVFANYSGKDRHYHNIAHLLNFNAQLEKCKELTQDDDILFVAMVYHDAIYNSPDHRDEERSAELAVKRLRSIGYPEASIKKCEALILATKQHALSADTDTNYFNDADMTILGLESKIYTQYVKDVRAEYGNTPQFDSGRKRILQYFLNMDRIFKTDFFNKIYEQDARNNIKAELESLQ